MGVLTIIFAGLMAIAGAGAATPGQAEALFARREWREAAAVYQALVDREPANRQAWFRLARALAAAGEAGRALEALQSWIGTGGGSYAAAMTVAELEPLRNDPRFLALLEPLKPCNAAEFRQFDFWLGDWDVTSPAIPGSSSRNRITLINGGCTLREEYTTPLGYAGTSLNFYDAERLVWHQTWIDNQGGALYLEGRLESRSMVLATTTDPQSIQRITWTPLEDGRVRQHWEATADGGKTWSTVFDGYYARRPE